MGHVLLGTPVAGGSLGNLSMCFSLRYTLMQNLPGWDYLAGSKDALCVSWNAVQLCYFLVIISPVSNKSCLVHNVSIAV